MSSAPVVFVFDTQAGDEEEDIYQVPALDINGLYSQLNSIRATTLPRNSIG